MEVEIERLRKNIQLSKQIKDIIHENSIENKELVAKMIIELVDELYRGI